jgi:hypothetical protein
MRTAPKLAQDQAQPRETERQAVASHRVRTAPTFEVPHSHVKLGDRRPLDPPLPKRDEELGADAEPDLPGAPPQHRQPPPARPLVRVTGGARADDDDPVQAEELGPFQTKSSRPRRHRSARSR